MWQTASIDEQGIPNTVQIKKGSIQKEKAVVTWEELGINALVCGEGAKVRAHLVVIQTGNVEINSNVKFYVYWWPRKV